MGYRTVVILYNDQCSEWSKDPLLGQKISIGMNDAMGSNQPRLGSTADLNYGMVVQCAHADTQTLAVIDGYQFHPILHSFWHNGEINDERTLRLLKESADRIGYKLVKKSQK